jgi:glycosyltransferase involved in cell wall biosynthesis
MQPSISCVIPVYNGKRDLERAVASVLGQRADAQVILVDDASTDGSRELVLELARREARIVAIPMAANRGQGYARNIGVAAAEARYVTFLDQDDEHLPGWYDHALGALESHPQYAGVRGELELAEVPPELAVGRGDPRWPAIVNSPIWNVVMRKTVYQALGGSPSGPAFRTRQGNEDWVVTETLKRHFTLAKADFVAVRHYVQPNGATAYFLRRTRVTADGRFEFIEMTSTEKEGALREALEEYQRRAAENIAVLRPQKQAEPEGALGRFVRKLTGA